MISVTALNVLLLLAGAAGIFIYRRLHPTKELNLFLILMLFSIVPLVSVWRKGSYQSGDFNDHVYFFMSFYNSLQDGIWFPRWSGGFCGGYGYPHIQFFYHLPYYLGSFFHYFLGTSFVDSQKLEICVSFFGAAAAMFLWLRTEFDQKAAFLGSVLYILSPYLLAGAHFRITLGEGLGSFLVPLILWCINKSFQSVKHKWPYWWGITFFYTLLILAHHVVPLLSLPFVVSYFLFKYWQSERRDRKQFIYFGIALATSFLVTSYHWAPILLETKWILQNQLRVIVFPPISSYFYSPWRYGLLNQGHYGELTWTVGYMHWLVILLSTVILFVKKVTRRVKARLLFLLGWFLLLFIMMLPFTEPLWLVTPLLNNFQFAFRMLFLINLVVAALTAVLVSQAEVLYLTFYRSLKGKLPSEFPRRLSDTHIGWIITLCVFSTSAFTVLNWGQRTVIPDLDDTKLELMLPSWCDQVAIPNWLDQKTFKSLPPKSENLVVVDGTALIQQKQYGMEEHAYSVIATDSATLRENTTYFPGWTAYLDGKIIPISISDRQYFGIMQVEVPAGMHDLRFAYEHTAVQVLFEKISLATLAIWSIVTVICLYESKYD